MVDAYVICSKVWVFFL